MPPEEKNNGFEYEEPVNVEEQRNEYGEYSEGTIIVRQDLNEVNEVEPDISEDDAPLVIFYGPKNCGKTMALVRLAKYLGSSHLSPEKTFRDDDPYKETCNNFEEVLKSDDAAASTSAFGFILVNLYDKGYKKVARILEAPGEHYFSEENPDAGYYAYFSDHISSNKHKRIWCFFVPLHWGKRETRKEYAAKINGLLGGKNPMIKKNDKVIFICSKADGLSVKEGNQNNLMDTIYSRLKKDSDFKKEVEKRYEGIFKNFSDGFWTGREKPFKFITFSAGCFTKLSNKIRYDVGEASEPEKLFKIIKKEAGFSW